MNFIHQRLCRSSIEFLTGYYCILILFFSLNILSQDQMIPFQQLNSRNGLTAPVKKIIQDQFGFMWFGSLDGVFRYDGKSLKAYRNRLNDSFSLSNNIINDLCLHPNGNIWIGSNGGLCYFSYEDQLFHRINLPDHLEKTDRYRIYAVTVDFFGQVFFATKTAVHILDHQLRIEKTIRLPSQYNYSISTICVSETQQLYIGLNTGELFCYDLCEPRFLSTKIFSEESKKLSLSTTITHIYPHPGDSILITSWYGGVHIVYKEDTVLKSKALLSNYEKDLQQKVITGLVKFSDTVWWIATHGAGISIFSPIQNKVSSTIRSNRSGYFGLSNDYLNDIFIDKTGIIWIGSQDGVHIYDRLSHQFSAISIPDQANEKSIYRRPSCFLEDTSTYQKVLWISVPGIGLLRYSRNTNLFDFIKLKNPDGSHVQDQSVYYMQRTDKNKILLSMNTGVYYFHTTKHTLELLTDPAEVEIKKARKIYQDSKSNFWITSWGNGVYHLTDQGKFLDHFSAEPDNSAANFDNTVFCILEDCDGMMWFGTQNTGLIKYNPLNRNFSVYSHDKRKSRTIPDNNVYDLYEDTNQALWIATENGLARMDKSKNEFKVFTTAEGLSNNDIFSIRPDLDGKLWLATNYGLSVLNTNTGNIINYSELDGLAGNRMDGASICCRDGYMYFGTNAMISGCNPSLLLRNENPPRVILTSVKVHGQELALTRRNQQLQTIKLSYTDNNFNPEFIALNYTHSSKNKYAYYLDGYDSRWNYIGNQSQTNFTNLNPGRYTLYLKASNNDGVWSHISDSVRIIIEPPFWKTWWFYSGIFLLVIGFIYSLVTIKWNQFRKLQQLRLDIARDLHDEVGSTISSINIISSMSDSLIKNGKSTSELFGTIQSASRKAMEMMNEIIWSIKPENDKPEMFFNRMRIHASETLESAGIEWDFVIDKQGQTIFIPLQIRKDLFLIFKEALNNILKHSQARLVVIRLEFTKFSLVLKIEDNGVGFDLKNPIKGNGLINMKARAQALGAEFALSSEISKGTSVMFNFPYKTRE